MRKNEETDTFEADEDVDLLQNRPLKDRALVISAGVIANLILAWSAIFVSVSSVGLPTYNLSPGATIASIVDTNGAGSKAGLRNGDVIVRLDGEDIGKSLNSASIVAEKIRTSGGRHMDFNILRDGEALKLDVQAKCCTPDGNSAIGVQLVPNATVSRKRAGSIPRAVSATNGEFGRLCKQTWVGLTSLVKNFNKSTQQFSGPIGVVSMGADLARNDAAALLTFCAVISINLALINSLPLPALDGGQMAFLIIELFKGSPISGKIQEAINRTAVLLLLAFSGVLFLGDLEKLNIVGAIQKLFG